MVQYGFHYDGSRCTGCKTCVLACKDAKDLSNDFAFRQVYEYGGGSFTQDDAGCWSTDSFVYYISTACNHCESPACVAACPQSSVVKDEETGLVYNDPETCIGCGTCAAACPYEVPKVDTEALLAVKCDGCRERVEAGGVPVCVESCPVRALEFGDIEELRAAYGDTAAIAPLPDPATTSPCVVITAPVCAESYDNPTGEILNQSELV